MSASHVQPAKIHMEIQQTKITTITLSPPAKTHTATLLIPTGSMATSSPPAKTLTATLLIPTGSMVTLSPLAKTLTATLLIPTGSMAMSSPPAKIHTATLQTKSMVTSAQQVKTPTAIQLIRVTDN